MTDGNENAFTSAEPEADGREGLTKREYFAAMAMSGLSANANSSTVDCYALAVKIADAFIEELNK